MNIRATPKGRVEASVIEATTVHGIGKVTTLVVARGTLRKGAVLVGGSTWCKVRTMTDENGKEMKEAGPGTPVRVGIKLSKYDMEFRIPLAFIGCKI